MIGPASILLATGGQMLSDSPSVYGLAINLFSLASPILAASVKF